jgi:hypothetical protein
MALMMTLPMAVMAQAEDPVPTPEPTANRLEVGDWLFVEQTYLCKEPDPLLQADQMVKDEAPVDEVMMYLSFMVNTEMCYQLQGGVYQITEKIEDGFVLGKPSAVVSFGSCKEENQCEKGWVSIFDMKEMALTEEQAAAWWSQFLYGEPKPEPKRHEI